MLVKTFKMRGSIEFNNCKMNVNLPLPVNFTELTSLTVQSLNKQIYNISHYHTCNNSIAKESNNKPHNSL